MAEKVKVTLEVDAEIAQLLSKTKAAKQSLQTLFDEGQNKGLQKQFNDLARVLERLRERGSEPFLSDAQFGQMGKAISNVQSKLKSLEEELTRIQDMSNAEKLDIMPKSIANNIRENERALQNFNRVSLESKQIYTDLKNQLDAARKAQSEFTEESKKALEQDLNTAKSAKEKAESKYIKAKESIGQKRKDYSTSKSALDNLEKETASEQKAELKKAERKLRDQQALLKDNKKAKDSGNLGRKKDPDVIEKEITGLEDKIEGLKKDIEKAEKDAEIPAKKRSVAALKGQVTKTENLIKAESEDEELKAATKNYQDAEEALKDYTDAAEVASQKVEKLTKDLEEQRQTDYSSAYNKLKNAATQAGLSIEGLDTYSEENAQKIKELLQSYNTEAIIEFDNQVSQSQRDLENYQIEIDNTKNANENGAKSFQELSTSAKALDRIAEHAKSFVGLAGGIQVARNAVRNAISTIKELDSAMTEMAVVTSGTVNDYWEQLPQYTSRANDLSVAIKEVYNASTLYYQQGLKTNRVVALSTPTLKMARIARLNAADATNKMTSALRGFNMELTEANAKNIADVYSKLAAVSASDVKEISTALASVASIAHSAGMEFETTSAFLAQMLETTRESATTAGAALRTIIARFQELKKSPDQIGEVDGEIVDANKIETALRSVGIALRDSVTGQFRDLDDVLIELSQKWNDLTVNQQRYISTIAAGSRQTYCCPLPSVA